MMLLLLGAFFAGVITVFAPCVFALLPVIIGGSISGNVQDKRRPIIIAASLAVSLFLFTLLFKASSLFIGISPALISYISGGIIVVLGVFLLFPSLYEKIILAFDLQLKSQQLLGKGSGKGAVVGAIITGAALGPVFSSCSPVYAYILATVLPVSFAEAIIYMIAYILGLSSILLIIGFAGQKLVRKLSWASNPHGWFQRVVAVLFIAVGLMIVTGFDKQFQTYISENTPFNFDSISTKLIPPPASQTSDDLLNVESYSAPKFTGISTWINSKPQTIAGLKGKVVLVDFWTYSCINCIRTQPYLKQWYNTYKESGFEIIGVHAPEFAFEKNPDNVRQAVKDAGLTYPIAMDNDLSTWAAYKNQYWPATYLIDRDGSVRRVHFGEGKYKEQEQAIRQLLAANGTKLPDASLLSDNATSSRNETPETYLGSRRAANFVGSQPLVQGAHNFTTSKLENVNDWALGGQWNVSSEGITAFKDSVLKFRVAARDVYLVTGSNGKGDIEVVIDGKSSKQTVSMAQLYTLVHFDNFESDKTIELRVPAGIQLNAFTFGS